MAETPPTYEDITTAIALLRPLAPIRGAIDNVEKILRVAAGAIGVVEAAKAQSRTLADEIASQQKTLAELKVDTAKVEENYQRVLAESNQALAGRREAIETEVAEIEATRERAVAATTEAETAHGKTIAAVVAEERKRRTALEREYTEREAQLRKTLTEVEGQLASARSELRRVAEGAKGLVGEGQSGAVVGGGRVVG